LAICEKGVWDKGGDAAGIRIDSEGIGEPQEKTVTAKLDELPVPDLPIQGEDLEPAPDLQAIPPGILALVDGLNSFANRLDRFITRRDLMIR
jgi:hypothetical protein